MWIGMRTMNVVHHTSSSVSLCSRCGGDGRHDWTAFVSFEIPLQTSRFALTCFQDLRAIPRPSPPPWIEVARRNKSITPVASRFAQLVAAYISF